MVKSNDDKNMALRNYGIKHPYAFRSVSFYHLMCLSLLRLFSAVLFIRCFHRQLFWSPV